MTYPKLNFEGMFYTTALQGCQQYLYVAKQCETPPPFICISREAVVASYTITTLVFIVMGVVLGLLKFLRGAGGMEEMLILQQRPPRQQDKYFDRAWIVCSAQDDAGSGQNPCSSRD